MARTGTPQKRRCGRKGTTGSQKQIPHQLREAELQLPQKGAGTRFLRDARKRQFHAKGCRNLRRHQLQDFRQRLQEDSHQKELQRPLVYEITTIVEKRINRTLLFARKVLTLHVQLRQEGHTLPQMMAISQNRLRLNS